MASTLIHLKLESPDGTVAEEFRVHNGRVERREWIDMESGDSGWVQLDAEQLKSAVYRNRAFAQWLEYRLGWRNAVRACSPAQLLESCTAQQRFSDQQAA